MDPLPDMVSLRLPVTEASQVSDARRRIAGLTRQLGFSETNAGKASLVVTEAARNLVKHTTSGGEILARAIGRGQARGLEILVLDRGPGIANVGAALQDGFSTAGSPGTGLGAIRRLAESFDLFSSPSAGTILLVRLWADDKLPTDPAPGLDIGSVCVAHPGETTSGDSWAVAGHGGKAYLLVVDGLGHGVLAGEAASQAVRAYRRHLEFGPEGILEALHNAMRATRGGVAAVAELDPEAGRVVYAGVGNITGVLHNADGTRSMVSHNGTLGQDIRKIQSFTYPWNAGTLLVMHSDGLQNRWDLSRQPGLDHRPAAVIAGSLYRDCRRANDDATVVVLKQRAP